MSDQFHRDDRGVALQNALRKINKMIDDATDSKAALVQFFGALAVTIVRLDEIPSEERTTANFERVLDGYCEVFVKLAEEEGKDIRDKMRLLREVLITAKRQVVLVTTPPPSSWMM